MAILNKLPTKNRMLQWGLAVDSMCVFCRSSIEDRDHLFFQCSITKRIWYDIMGLCLVSDAKTYWKELVNWGTTQLKGRVFRTLQCKLAWWATVYQLCEQRNVFYMQGRSIEEQLIGIIKKNVKRKNESNKFNCNSVYNQSAFLQMGDQLCPAPIPCLEVDFGWVRINWYYVCILVAVLFAYYGLC